MITNELNFGDKPKKDWTGSGKNSIYTTLGASNHVDEDREVNDYYATHPEAMEKAPFLHLLSNVNECACGAGHLAKVLQEKGLLGRATDLVNRGYGEGGVDFLSIENQAWDGDVVTNPPYKYASEFVIKALEIIPEGRYVAMFLKTTFAEGKERKQLFAQYPPLTIYQSSSRIACAKNGDFEGMKKSGGSAVAYCWWLWQKGFKGVTSFQWFN